MLTYNFPALSKWFYPRYTLLFDIAAKALRPFQLAHGLMTHAYHVIHLIPYDVATSTFRSCYVLDISCYNLPIQIRFNSRPEMISSNTNNNSKVV